jgi:hypothetical protein
MNPLLIAIIILVIIILAMIGTLVWALLTRQPSAVSLSTEYPEWAGLIQIALQATLQLLSQTNAPVPDIYKNCPGSTVNRLKFCDKLKTSGNFDVGGIGSIMCSTPYTACKAACAVGCAGCHLIPFIGCGKPCNDCPNTCKKAYNLCTGAYTVSWSVNVKEVTNLANTMKVLPFESFSVGGDKKKKILYAKIPIEVKPQALIDVRTTGTVGNYQGAVDLGKLKAMLSIEFAYDCKTKQTTLRKLYNIQVSGVDLNFHFADGFLSQLKAALFNAAKTKLNPAVKKALEEKLSPLFETWVVKEVLPKVKLNIAC